MRRKRKKRKRSCQRIEDENEMRNRKRLLEDRG